MNDDSTLVNVLTVKCRELRAEVDKVRATRDEFGCNLSWLKTENGTLRQQRDSARQWAAAWKRAATKLRADAAIHWAAQQHNEVLTAQIGLLREARDELIKSLAVVARENGELRKALAETLE